MVRLLSPRGLCHMLHLHGIAESWLSDWIAPTKNSLYDLASAYFSDITFPKVSPKMNYLPCLKTPWSLVPRCHDTDNPYCLFTFWLLQQHGWIHLPHFSSDITTPTTPNSLISSGKNAPLSIHCFVTICLSISQKKKNASTQMHLPSIQLISEDH